MNTHFFIIISLPLAFFLRLFSLLQRIICIVSINIIHCFNTLYCYCAAIRYIRAKYADRAFLPGKGKPRQSPVTSTEDPPISTSSSSQQPSGPTAGAIEFVGILRVTIVSGKLLGGGLQLASLPYVCAGLGTQVFKTKPGTKDKKNPIFQEVCLHMYIIFACIHTGIM